jgi:hypothetical protein
MPYRPDYQRVRDNIHSVSLLMFRTGKTYEAVKTMVERRAAELREKDGGLCSDYWSLALASILQDMREGD